ncbi:hypothetical protein LTR67_011088 [Exophiala xenobiotica]
MERVERAKQVRSIYWHVPAKANTPRPRVNSIANINTIRDAVRLRNAGPRPSAQTETTIQELQETTGTMTVQLEPPTILSPTMEQVPTLTQASILARESTETVTVQTAEILSIGEEWTTPATQQDFTHPQLDPSIDPRLTEGTFPLEEISEAYPPQQSTQPIMVPEGTLETQDADAWLDNMFNDGTTSGYRTHHMLNHHHSPARRQNHARQRLQSSGMQVPGTSTPLQRTGPHEMQS